MKKLLIIIILIAGCKKKDTPPADPEPTPPVTQSCTTGKTLFTGKYKCIIEPGNVIEFVFKHNNCPAENSNTYIVENFAEAVKDLVSVPVSPPNGYEVKSNEVYKYADSSLDDGRFNFAIQPDSTIKLTGKNLKFGSIKFVRI